MRKTRINQAEEKAQLVRELVLSAEKNGIQLQEISIEARMGYQRLRRFCKYDGSLSAEEMQTIESVITSLAQTKANQLASLVSA